jgi:methanethiol oxidase
MLAQDRSPNRRHFIQGSAAAVLIGCGNSPSRAGIADSGDSPECCDRTYASVVDAIKSPPETLAYVPGIYTGTGVERPDYLATIDLDITSPTYGKIIHRLSMPHLNDELHHFGWNSCSSCHGQEGVGRRYIVLPGIASSRIYIVDTLNPRQPKLHKVIEPEQVKGKSGLSAPHTVHCLASGEIMISMLGKANGEAPGGFLLLDEDFEIKGRWEHDATGMNFNYDFWYQPRQNVMVSSEWGAPNTVSQGFSPEDVAAGKYGRHLHFWDWNRRMIIQSIDLGENGWIPLEVRFHHDPNSTHGFVGAALSSTMWHWFRQNDRWAAEQIIGVQPIEVDGWPFPVPGLITDLVLSMDDRFLYFSNWLHGDIRQYDVSNPSQPKLTGQIWLGGVLGKGATVLGKKLTGGPQMLQLSLDGQRLYVTNSLYSPWDNQFYPEMAQSGSYFLKIDCDNQKGGMKLDESFLVDFGREPHGAARAHEVRFATGDSTSDIWS